MTRLAATRRDVLIAAASLAASSRLPIAPAQAALSRTGTFERPYDAQSLWNARPIDPQLGTDAIPADHNNAYLEQSKYSSKLYRATASDGPVVVQGRNGANGMWVADELRTRNVTIPHFPAGTVPASGSDGHCEIFDEPSGLVHSFYGLIFDSEANVWRASKYTVTSIDGTGWGSPACPDGPRASGTPSTSGLLRAHELGRDVVPHALAVAAHANVFRSGPIFPATLEDRDGGNHYSGRFAMGTLFMLPPDFDAEQLNWPNTRAIARTLKLYGARLIDQTQNTFSFGGEMDGGWSPPDWRRTWAQDLTKMRDSLRPVVSVSRWLDANGVEFAPKSWEQMNLLSMRGPWTKTEGGANIDAGYETSSKMFLFPELTAPLAYRKSILVRNDRARDPWFQWTGGAWYINPLPDHEYRLRVEGFGEATAAFMIRTSDGVPIAMSDMRPGQETRIRWPDPASSLASISVRAPSGPPSGIRLILELV
ncbi:hypothetical protein [Bradyrhizobium sp. USDA 4486]